MNIACPTESSAGGTLIYIGNHLLYKPRNDLSCVSIRVSVYELESTFIELINTKKSIVFIGAIYWHSSTGLDEFNDLP